MLSKTKKKDERGWKLRQEPKAINGWLGWAGEVFLGKAGGRASTNGQRAVQLQGMFTEGPDFAAPPPTSQATNGAPLATARRRAGPARQPHQVQQPAAPRPGGTQPMNELCVAACSRQDSRETKKQWPSNLDRLRCPPIHAKRAPTFGTRPENSRRVSPSSARITRARW